MSKRIVVSRKWDNPQILAFATDIEVGATMQMPDFITALAAEVGSPALLMTKGGLEKALKQASDRVLAEMKSTTKYVV